MRALKINTCSSRAIAPRIRIVANCRPIFGRPREEPKENNLINGSHEYTRRDVHIHAFSGLSGSDPMSSSDGEAPSPRLLGINFQDLYYYLNVSYWGALLISVLTGNDFLAKVAHFEVYTSLMFGISCLFSIYFLAKWVVDMKKHLQEEKIRDVKSLLRYSWNAAFWLGFVLWYAAPVSLTAVELTGTPGAIMCIYGIGLALSSALLVGMWSFMGEPQIPRHLVTTGPYALLRHPQALGNMLFLIGFSMAGGALPATASFVLAFYLYIKTVIPKEEAMLEAAFGTKYMHYKERVPSFAWALILLLIVEAFLIWRYAPFAGTAVPIRPISV